MSEPQVILRTLLYSKAIKLFRSAEPLPGHQEAELVDSVEEAKEKLLSGIYKVFFVDFTYFDYTGQRLIQWVHKHCSNVQVFQFVRNFAFNLSAQVWEIDKMGLFKEKNTTADILTMQLSSLISDNPMTKWGASVHSEFAKMHSKLHKDLSDIVLMIGAAGTAKYSLAQIDHCRSTRSGNPFIFVNCKIHGKMKIENWCKSNASAFRKNITCILTKANGGTVYFHEVDHMDVTAQKLLSDILSQRFIETPDGKSKQRFKGLIICSTRHNLEELVEVGEFSDTLFSLISTNVIRIPSLSDFRDEIGTLANELLQQHCLTVEHPPMSFSDDAIAKLSAHVWGRNMRELDEIVRHSSELASGSHIVAEDVLFEESHSASDEYQAQRCAIKKALIEAGGMKVKAAKILKTSRNTLYSWLEKYNIDQNFGKT